MWNSVRRKVPIHGWQLPRHVSVFLIQSAGIEEQDASQTFIRIKRRSAVEEDGKTGQFFPLRVQSVLCHRFRPSGFRGQQASCPVLDFSSTSFVKGRSGHGPRVHASTLSICAHRIWPWGVAWDNAIVVTKYRCY